MPTEDGFDQDYPLPLFLIGRDEPQGIRKAYHRAVLWSRVSKASILIAGVMAAGIAVLSAGEPATLLAAVRASLVGDSGLRPAADRPDVAAQSSVRIKTPAAPPSEANAAATVPAQPKAAGATPVKSKAADAAAEGNAAAAAPAATKAAGTAPTETKAADAAPAESNAATAAPAEIKAAGTAPTETKVADAAPAESNAAAAAPAKAKAAGIAPTETKVADAAPAESNAAATAPAEAKAAGTAPAEIAAAAAAPGERSPADLQPTSTAPAMAASMGAGDDQAKKNESSSDALFMQFQAWAAARDAQANARPGQPAQDNPEPALDDSAKVAQTPPAPVAENSSPHEARKKHRHARAVMHARKHPAAAAGWPPTQGVQGMQPLMPGVQAAWPSARNARATSATQSGAARFQAVRQQQDADAKASFRALFGVNN